MNIFVLDNNIDKSVKYLCDSHVVKMVLETAQMLCSPFESAPYKRTHYNHPCNIWIRSSIKNYEWLLNYGDSICSEYSYRYNKIHKSQKVIEWCRDNYKSLNLPKSILTKHPKCMPDEMKKDSVVDSYRNFYILDKSRFAKWNKNREKPDWYIKDNL
jgi:hypothetical protein